MTASLSVLPAVCWFIFGVIVGAQWTRMRRQVGRLANIHVRREEPVQPPPHTAPRSRRWPRRVLDAFVVLLFIGSAVQAYVTYDQLQESADRIQAVVDCQRAYQTGFADALDARSAASTEAQNANDELWATVGQLTSAAASPETRVKFQAALSNYFDKRAEAKKQQQDNPYPPSPRDLCK